MKENTERTILLCYSSLIDIIFNILNLLTIFLRELHTYETVVLKVVYHPINAIF